MAAHQAGSLRRMVHEQANASIPDMGIYVPEAVQDSPCKGCAVLLPLAPSGAPSIVSFEYKAGYPFSPLAVSFLTVVSHPLVSPDGSIDVDILRDRWSPALSLGTVLISIQNMLTEPTHPDFFHVGCVRNPNWESGIALIPPEHAPKLFEILLAAALPGRGWKSTEALCGVQRCLRSGRPLRLAAASAPKAWDGFLRKLLAAERSLHPSAMGRCEVLWRRAVRDLLREHFPLDGLRVLVRARSDLARCAGELRRLPPVLWNMVREYISSLEDAELFAPVLLAPPVLPAPLAPQAPA